MTMDPDASLSSLATRRQRGKRTSLLVFFHDHAHGVEVVARSFQEIRLSKESRRLFFGVRYSSNFAAFTRRVTALFVLK